MSNNCLAKTERHLAETFWRSLKYGFFKNLNSVWQKRWLDVLKKTSQRHLRSVSKTLLRQLMKLFLRYLNNSCFTNLTNVWANHYLENLYTYVKLSRMCFTVSSNQFLWNSGLILPSFCHFFRNFYPNFCQFSGSRLPL